jgi:hypothetical protein
MNRIKARYRSWAIPCGGTSVYAPRHRADSLTEVVSVNVARNLSTVSDTDSHSSETSGAVPCLFSATSTFHNGENKAKGSRIG